MEAQPAPLPAPGNAAGDRPLALRLADRAIGMVRHLLSRDSEVIAYNLRLYWHTLETRWRIRYRTSPLTNPKAWLRSRRDRDG